MRFHGEVNFSGRSFERTADFTNTQFLFRNFPPDFDSATNLSRIDFAGAHTGAGPLHFFRLTYDPRVVNRIRALRKAAEEDRNHDLEHGLFMEERKAQRGLSFGQPLEALKTGSWRNWPRNTAQLIANFPWIIVMGLYWALADYGRSFVRPFLCWLVLSLVIFPWWYSQILPVPLHMSFLDAYNMSKRFNWLRAPMLCLSSVRSR